MKAERFLALAFAGLAALSLVACGGDDDDNNDTMNTAGKSIAAIAAGDARFTTLVAALQRTGLDATLAGSGSFTVFAPTNDAFARLPAGVVEGLDAATLKTILQYHVIAGAEIKSNAIVNGKSPDTVQGGKLDLYVEGSTVVINGVVQVQQADITATNGVLHVIDGVLLPIDFPGNVVAAVSAYPRLQTLRDAVVAAELAGTLSSAAAVTIFAPTTTAFSALPMGVLDTLLQPANKPQLQETLEYHVLGSTLHAADITAAANANGLGEATVPTLITTHVKAALQGGGVMVNDAHVLYTDINASNGVIHVIDKVLTVPGDIVSVATAAGFTSLVNALSAQSLASALTYSASNTTQFTVFAPTNDAFADLGGGAPTGDALTQVLKYHVVAGTQVDANAAFGLTSGGPATVTSIKDDAPNTLVLARESGGLTVNGVPIATTDVIARNGIIHVIGQVLVPPAP